MATIDTIIRNPIKFPFRKCEIKRRQTSDGLYETSFFDITKFVTKWGTLQTSLDDEQINRFTHAGIQLTVRNNYGEFNPEHEGQSLFFDFFTRYRTLVRIQAGYTDGAGNSFPTSTNQGTFILDGEINLNPKNNTARLNCKSIISPLQEVRANEVDGITASITSSEIIAKIRDATDGSGNVIFRQFISTSSWNIQTTTNVLNGFNTTTTLDNFSVWELMNGLAEIEGFVVHATREGGIVFSDRSAATAASQFSLFGAGFRRPNIISMPIAKEAVNKLFTHVRYKYLEDNTASSFVEAGTQTLIDVGSLEWKYGRRTLELQNTFITDTATAQDITRKIVNEFSNLRSEVTVETVFLPQIELLDRVDVSYRESSLNSVMLWDIRDWAADTTTSDTVLAMNWASETSSTIDYSKKNFKVIARKTNLDKFTTTLVLRESEV